jgi:hypothetical protein
VTLFQANIVEILETIREHCKQVRITDNEYEYEDLEEIKRIRGTGISSLDISGQDPSMTFSIGNRLTLEASETASIPYLRIRAILDHRKRWLLNLLFKPTVMVILLVTYIVLVAFLFTRRHFYSNLNLLLYFPAIVYSFVSVPLALNVHVGKYSKILLLNKHERPSFWARNKDELLRQIISNILAFGLGILAAYLLFKQGIK